MDWKNKYDSAKYGIIAFLILFFIGLTSAYLATIYPSSLKAFYKILLNGSKMHLDEVQTRLYTITMLPALFFFYFLQFRWQMHRASQAFVGMILFVATFMMAAKFL